MHNVSAFYIGQLAEDYGDKGTREINK